MKEPDHKVKRHIVPFSRKRTPYWLHYPVHGWLGSGVNDKNDVEIFEGDKVIFGERELHGVITFKNASFGISYELDGTEKFILLAQTIGFVDIEIVGHIAEDEL